MLKLNITKQAKKFIESLPPKQAKQLAFKIQELRLNPQPHDSKKLKGYSYLRSDIGEYRIIYMYDETLLEIIFIDKRNDDAVYKKIKKNAIITSFLKIIHHIEGRSLNV